MSNPFDPGQARPIDPQAEAEQLATARRPAPTEPRRYRKKSVDIEAVQLTRENFRDAVRFVPMSQFSAAGEDCGGLFIAIRVLDGVMRADEGDWIIRSIQGEQLYPCKPDIFAKTYEAV